MPSKKTQSQLESYRQKRRAGATPEPMGRTVTAQTGKLFVIQQHAASHLHFDLRLEHRGVLKSWAVPKGPSPNPADKRFAALVEDHPLDYAEFEGRIPDGNYGAGHVIVWDRGIWEPLSDVAEGLKKGKLLFNLFGYKVKGRWTLVRMQPSRNQPNRGEDGKDWLFIKERDAYAQEAETNEEVGEVYPDTSILSGLTVKELAQPAAVHRRLSTQRRRLIGTQPYTATAAPRPMLAKSGDAFDDADWLFEFKYDGYRALARKDPNGTCTLFSRNGHDLSPHFPEVIASLSRLRCSQFVLDGELVVNDPRGVPSFALLQTRAKLPSELEVARASIEQTATYYLFDLLAMDEIDATSAPLDKRKRLLRALLPTTGVLRYSEHIKGNGRATYEQALRLGLEGVVAKAATSSYQPGRSSQWIKVRNRRTDEFVIVGYTANRNHANDLGAVALGEYRAGVLTYVGNVGSGLGEAARRSLQKRLKQIPPGQALDEKASRVHWVKPKLVCEIAFKEYTRLGHVRQGAFVRLREDKRPSECVGRFLDAAPATLSAAPPPVVTVTNPDKIFFPELGYTKSDLVTYYEKISTWMLPYLKDRPIVLTRFPDGIHGKSFYQRDAPDFVPDWIQRAVLYSEGADREVNYFIVRTSADLRYLANMGTIPIHMWHSRLDNLQRPDWCVLDLDPKDAPFTHVIELARAAQILCDELELPSFAKTSGASGLHVLIPLRAQLDHEQAKTLGELLARELVRRHPEIATVTRAVRRRDGKVYVDYLQNGHGRLIVAPFSARAEPTAGVSMPLTWQQVNKGLSNGKYHIGNAVARMKRAGDAMAPLLSADVDLLRGLHKLNRLVQT